LVFVITVFVLIVPGRVFNVLTPDHFSYYTGAYRF
jgi:hypothetical protein